MIADIYSFYQEVVQIYLKFSREKICEISVRTKRDEPVPRSRITETEETSYTKVECTHNRYYVPRHVPRDEVR